MNIRDGTTSVSPCFIRQNSNAPATAFAVHEPMRPWSYTFGQCSRRSTWAGRAATTRGTALNRWSRKSGRSGTQPYRVIAVSSVRKVTQYRGDEAPS